MLTLLFAWRPKNSARTGSNSVQGVGKVNRQPLSKWKRTWHCWLVGAILGAAVAVPVAQAQPQLPTQLPPVPPGASGPPLMNKSQAIPAARQNSGDKEARETGEKPEVLPPP